MDKVGRYLGVDLDYDRRLHDFLHKIQAKLEGWKGSLSSQAARLTLIQSIVDSLATFWLSFIHLPKSITPKVDSAL